MAIGTHVTTFYSSVINTYTTSAITMAVFGRFNYPVKMRSVSFWARTTATGSAKVVIYDSAGVKIFDGAPQTVSSTAGIPCEISMGVAFELVANTDYYIGIYHSSGLSFGYGTPVASGANIASSPALVTFTKSSSGAKWKSGDVFPNMTDGGYEIIQGFSYDTPPPVLLTVSPNGTVIDNMTDINFAWTLNGAPQMGYEIGYRKKAKEALWTVQTSSNTTASHTFSADTFEDDIVYEWYVRLKGSDGTLGQSLLSTFTNISWTNYSEVSSASTTGVIDAASLPSGDYDIEVRVAPADGRYGNWSPLTTFTLNPPSNIWVKQGGVWKQSVNYAKVSGVFKQVAPTKLSIENVVIGSPNLNTTKVVPSTAYRYYANTSGISESTITGTISTVYVEMEDSGTVCFYTFNPTNFVITDVGSNKTVVAGMNKFSVNISVNAGDRLGVWCSGGIRPRCWSTTQYNTYLTNGPTARPVVGGNAWGTGGSVVGGQNMIPILYGVQGTKFN